MGTYIPVACRFHDRLELAVLQRLRLRLQWRDAALGLVEREVMPVDVLTRDGAEWLVFRDEAGGTASVRLDRLCQVNEIPHLK